MIQRTEYTMLSRRTLTVTLVRLAATGFLAGCRLGSDRPSESGAGAAASHCNSVETRRGETTTYIVIDKTTSLDPADRAQLVRELSGDVELTGGRAAVIVFGGTGAGLIRKTFDRRFLAPAGAGSTPAKRWSMTPTQERTAQACMVVVRRSLETELERALSDIDLSDSGYSPVIEAVAAVLGSATTRHGGTRLVLISDGIQRTPSMSWYVPGSDRLRLAQPKALVDELARVHALPDMRGVQVFHLGFALSAAPISGASRVLRPPSETQALAQTYETLYRAAGAATFAFGQPLLADGIRSAPTPAEP